MIWPSSTYQKSLSLQSGAYLYIWGKGVKINAPTQAGYKKAKEKFEKRYIFIFYINIILIEHMQNK